MRCRKHGVGNPRSNVNGYLLDHILKLRCPVRIVVDTTTGAGCLGEKVARRGHGMARHGAAGHGRHGRHRNGHLHGNGQTDSWYRRGGHDNRAASDGRGGPLGRLQRNKLGH
jgi:hypothetical protein